MTGAAVPDGDGARAAYVGIEGETERDAAMAREVISQATAMPPGSFVHPDDPNDHVKDHGDEPKPERESGRQLDDRQPPEPLTGVAVEVEALMREREGGIAGLRQQLLRMEKDMHARFDEITPRRGRPADVTASGMVWLRDFAIEQARLLERGEISLQGFIAKMEWATRRATEAVKRGRRAVSPTEAARKGRGRENKV